MPDITRKNSMPERKILLGLVALLLTLSLASCSDAKDRHEQREGLATLLGIQLEEHPPDTAFPVSYYRSAIASRSSMSTVHTVIQGYEKVLHCTQGAKREIYYYFASSDRTALRFEVWYYDDRSFDQIRSEDDDSRSIRPEGCVPGRYE